jgi:thiamine phosphate synthase YjbQ (UPF0047 family)
VLYCVQGPKAPWVHTDEGYDDMPAHCKASMMGASLSIPITAGRLNLGTWQVSLYRMDVLQGSSPSAATWRPPEV